MLPVLGAALAVRPSLDGAEASGWACAAPAPVGSVQPVLKLRGAERYGSDPAAQDFAWHAMQAAARWRACGDVKIARWAVDALARWAAADALAEPLDVGATRSNTNSIYSLRRALTALLGAWIELRPTAPATQAAEIERWLRRIAAVQDVSTGAAATRDASTAVSNRNNHSYMRAAIDAQLAVLFESPEKAARAQRGVAGAVDAMNRDGSLPLEVARGGRALWYQRHALASLVYIGELLAPMGRDVWSARADGGSLHDAVAFLAEAVENPALVAGYAAANRDPAPGVDPALQDLTFLERRRTGRHYMAWLEFYRARFPDRPAGARLAHRIALDAVRPLVDDYVGGDATCRVLRPPARAR